MKNRLKVAVYSGAVPSTTFIERLVLGMASQGVCVYLFGLQTGSNPKRPHVFNYTYSMSRWNKLYQLVKYSVLLRLFKSKDKNKLDAIIRNRGTHTRLLKVKYYPVLYHRPDIFHLQWAKSIEDWIWVRDFGMKLIVSLRGTHITISPIASANLADLYTHFFPHVDGFHAVSQSLSIEAQRYGAAPSKIKTIYSGLSLNAMTYLLKTEKKETLNILSVGRSHWAKGYPYALDAMAALKSKQVSFHYTLVGVAEDEALRFQRAQLGLEQEVTFLGMLPFEAVKVLQQQADVLVLPSVEEGIANVVLEAMVLGTVVVSTDCGGMHEVIQDGLNGFLVPPRDPEAMALVLQNISKLSIVDYQNMTRAARMTIEQQHGENQMVTEMLSLYEKVLNNELCE
ncbi:glycosyltransferase family 4 protein [Flavobacteriaceae bacterium LMO-SS05]